MFSSAREINMVSDIFFRTFPETFSLLGAVSISVPEQVLKKLASKK